MTDCMSKLYKLVRKSHPYVPASHTEQAVAAELSQAKRHLDGLSPEQRQTLFLLEDNLEILACYQAQHFFCLGLDLGLSLARELRPFQEGR